jgi:nicotinamide-nucleotide amidase
MRTDEATLERLAERMLALAREKDLTIITAESCTGGRLAALLSDAEGASGHLHGGFVTYTKENKTAALGVPPALLMINGAVSEPVARAMANGALERSPADLAVAVTGGAGPAPDPDGNPVGLVHIVTARRGRATMHVQKRYGDLGRDTVLERTMVDALLLLERVASQDD